MMMRERVQDSMSLVILCYVYSTDKFHGARQKERGNSKTQVSL